MQRDQTQGQAPRQQGQQGQTGAAPQGQTGTSPQGQTGTAPQGQTGTAPQGQATQGGQAGGNVNLTSEQRTEIRQQVLAGSNVPRVNNVNFAVSVGTVVPTTVHVVEVPAVLVRIHPEWRGHRYFVYQDEIIIVDTGHRIVAVLPV